MQLLLHILNASIQLLELEVKHSHNISTKNAKLKTDEYQYKRNNILIQKTYFSENISTK